MLLRHGDRRGSRSDINFRWGGGIFADIFRPRHRRVISIHMHLIRVLIGTAPSPRVRVTVCVLAHPGGFRAGRGSGGGGSRHDGGGNRVFPHG